MGNSGFEVKVLNKFVTHDTVQNLIKVLSALDLINASDDLKENVRNRQSACDGNQLVSAETDVKADDAVLET